MKTKRQSKSIKIHLQEIWKQRYLYILLIPAFAFLILFSYVPMSGAVIAFKDYNPLLGIWGSPWAGLKYFEKLFSGIYFERLMVNTLSISIFQILWGFPAPIVFALFLNEIQSNKFKRTIQTITYLPHFMSWVVIGGFMITLFSSTEGIIVPILNLFGVEITNPILTNANVFRGILVGSNIWKSIGWGSIVYLASMTSIDAELYEVADLDGAGRFRKMFHITLPCIMPTIMAMLILRLGSIMQSNFEQIYILYSASVYEVADVFATYIFREGLGNGNFSFTTAVGLFQSVVGFILVVASNYLSRKAGRGLW